MTQNDKKILLIDLCARLPYEVKISVDNKIEVLEGLGILDNVAECRNERGVLREF